MLLKYNLVVLMQILCVTQKINQVISSDYVSIKTREAISMRGRYGFSELKHSTDVVEMGVGKVDFEAPQFLLNSITNAINGNDTVAMNQYTYPEGETTLRKSIAAFYGKLVGQQIDYNSEVLVTIGATAGITVAIRSFINPGEEVVILEPAFSLYRTAVHLAGGVPVVVQLDMPDSLQSKQDIKLNKTKLEAAFTSRTKLLILNNPHNPTGKMFTLDELSFIATLCIQEDVLVLSDEVYEFLTYSGRQINRIASLPGMWNRTITVGSSSKTWSVTGWRVGWAYGPASLIRPMQFVHTATVLSAPTMAQKAIALAFYAEIKEIGTKNSFWTFWNNMLQAKRDFVIEALTDYGFNPIVPEGAFYVTVDMSPLENSARFQEYKPTAKSKIPLLEWLAVEKGIEGHSVSNFYGSPELQEKFKNWWRLCFIKSEDTLKRFIVKISNVWN